MDNNEHEKLTVEGRRGRLTDLGCPDCRGVLAMELLGEQRHMRFACQVGHAFSQESLLAAKESEVEQALWSAIETFEEIKMLCGALADKAGEASDSEGEAPFRDRAVRAARSSQLLREVLAHDGPPGSPVGTTADKEP